MALEKFELAALAKIDDGRLRVAWEQALRRGMLDCEDRPGVAKARKVLLVATLIPVQEPDGSMGSCNVAFEIDDNLPKRQSPTYNMLAKQGRLYFNEFSKEDVRQMTLDENGPRIDTTEEEREAHADAR